jgi:MFS family permease
MEVVVSAKQLVALAICRLVVFTAGGGLFPLLPVYAIRLGAQPAFTGYYLSLSFLATAMGTILAGWLSDKFQRRKALLIVAGGACLTATWLMGHATSIWLLVVLTVIVWFCAGVGLALISILTGLFAEESERGKVFGILEAMAALGAVISGASLGLIADRGGYPIMFEVDALIWGLYVLAGLWIADKVVIPGGPANVADAGAASGRRGGLSLLLLASVVAGTAGFVGNVGTSLAMNELGFKATAISSTAAIGGAVTLPLPALVGWLSDGIGRKRFLALCYLAGTAGLSILLVSALLWQFWLASALVYVFQIASRGVASALVTDLVTPEALGRGLSLFNATYWIGAVVGVGVAGYSVQQLGLAATFGLSASLPLIAILFLLPIRRAARSATA